MSPRPLKNPPQIVLPVGGGKGGIGKSAVTANLGLALARLDHTVLVVDADLGGSDLHEVLGLPNDQPGIGELMTAKGLKVEDVVAPALEPRFNFLAGDAMMVATANPSYQKKRKILHAVKKQPVDFILLDLGAGTAITVMDFYLTSPLSLVIMLPEQPAVKNAFNFLKNAVFRAMDRIFRDNAGTKSALAEFQVRGRGPGAMKMDELVEAIDKAVPGQGQRALRAVQRWRPKLVLNRVRRVEDFAYARQLETWAAEDLGLPVEVFGFLPEDDIVREAAAQGKAALDIDPRAPFCRAVAILGLNIGQWAGRPRDWAAHSDFYGSFERAATQYATLFPPPGTPVPTRDELERKLKEVGVSLTG